MDVSIPVTLAPMDTALLNHPFLRIGIAHQLYITRLMDVIATATFQIQIVIFQRQKFMDALLDNNALMLIAIR